jgi:hypothetical protein
MLAAIALVLWTTGPAAPQYTPEERYFRVESSVLNGKKGPEIEGYVYNVYDQQATRVRLRVESRDAAGQKIDERFVFVPLDVPPRGRSYFRAPVAASTATTRATVFYFEWSPRGGGG